MKNIQAWLNDYQQSHMNPVNKTLHWICVPQIVFAILLGFKSIPVGNDWINVTTIAALGGWLYYLTLSRPLALGMIPVFVVMYAGVIVVEGIAGKYTPWLAAAIFVEAWVGQFIGHHVEGARPSFYKDLQFLMIGPLWLLADVYRRLDWPLQSKSAAA